MTQETESTTGIEALLAKLASLIKAQAGGKVSGFSTENLNYAYMSLVEGTVDEAANELLIKMIGPDWSKDYEPEEQDLQSLALEEAITESVEQIDVSDPQSAAATLASALMVACRELGWLDASRAAHDYWFYANKMSQ